RPASVDSFALESERVARAGITRRDAESRCGKPSLFLRRQMLAVDPSRQPQIADVAEFVIASAYGNDTCRISWDFTYDVGIPARPVDDFERRPERKPRHLEHLRSRNFRIGQMTPFDPAAQLVHADQAPFPRTVFQAFNA